MVKGTAAEYDIYPLYPDELKTQSLSLTPNPEFAGAPMAFPFV
jgi:hypothetical protein